MQVRIFCGASAYACITDGDRQTDIRLSPGKSASQSLREYAQEERARAARISDMADLAERAAAELDKQDEAPGYIRAGERLWNGATVTPLLAIAYNRLTDRIRSFEREGLPVPEHVINSRHKLIAQAV